MAKDSKLRDFYLPAVGIRDGDHRSSSSEDTLQRLAHYLFSVPYYWRVLPPTQLPYVLMPPELEPEFFY